MYEIVSVRTIPADDGSHSHVELIGYISTHIPGEPIMIPVARALQKIAFGEKFVVASSGEQVEVKAGKCSECGHEPVLEPQAAILALPQL